MSNNLVTATTNNLAKATTNDSFLILSILLGFFIFLYIYPNIIIQNKKEGFIIDNKINNLIETTSSLPIFIDNDSSIKEVKDNSISKIDQNICSKQCCKFIQWPIPFNTRNPIISDETLNKFIPSNLSCTGGCVCLTKDDFNYLSNHGQS
jgi:hypothetical protein